MKKLIKGILDFRRNVRPSYREQFQNLGLGQKPDTLMIACSDSRVAPNVFASTDPGDLFVVRNVGNLIPPRTVGIEAHSESAALEFSLTNLPIEDIIVCGHSNCGAMHALVSQKSPAHASASESSLGQWLRYGQDALARFNTSGSTLTDVNERANELSRLNVLQQLEHLKTYPLVRERMAAGKLRLHAWWFHIDDAEVLAHTGVGTEFRAIDETLARQWLGGAGPDHDATLVVGAIGLAQATAETFRTRTRSPA